MHRILHLHPSLSARLCAALLLLGTPAFAGSVPPTTVTTTADTVANDGQTSLREALASVPAGGFITFANTTANGEAVDFYDGAVHTITLGGTELAITKSLTITGPGAKALIVDANHASRAFHITGASSALIDGLTITNGQNVSSGQNAGSGGGIYNQSGKAVRVTNCLLSNNFAFNGGAINHETSALLEVANCTFSSNSTWYYGGGIFNFTSGTINVANSTFVGGSSTSGSGSGGAMDNASGGVINISNCTIAGNDGHFNGGVDNSPFNGGVVRVANSIIVGNTASSFGPDVMGPFVSLGYNLIGGNNNATGFTNGTNGDQVGVSLANSGLELDNNNKPKLADNGGPTATVKLLPGSLAIDAGDNAQIANDPATGQTFTTDQRGAGFARIVKGKPASASPTVDAGAFEVQLSTASFANGVAADGITVDIADAPFDLTGATVGATPAGGTFTGLGVTANSLHFDLLETGDYTITYQGPADAYGNPPEPITFTVHITAADPYLRVIATQAKDGSGADVPNEPAGTKFTQFGLPSVSGRQVGARVKIKPPGGKDTLAIFAGTTTDAGVLARAGDPAPGVGGPSGTFKTFGEPVFGYDSLVHAFTATVAGAPKGGEKGLWANLFGANGLELIAGNGIPVPDATGTSIGGAVFDKILSYSLTDETNVLTFLATIKGPGIKAGNNTGIWQTNATGTALIFRTGDACDLSNDTFGAGPDVIQKLAFPAPAKTIPGQRRSYTGVSQSVTAVASFAKGRQAVLTSSGTGLLNLTRSVAFQSLKTAGVGKLGQPSLASQTAVAMRANLTKGVDFGIPPAPVTAKDDQVILGLQLQPIAREGSPVSTTVADVYTAFEEPAANTTGQIAFFAKVKGAGLPASQTSVLIYNREPLNPGAYESIVLARTGTAAADLTNGELWKSFTAMVTPDGFAAPVYGPVLLAKLTGPGVKASNAVGLWAMDKSEKMRLLVRTGDTILVNGANRTVSLITTLGAAKDSAGQGRYVDLRGSVAAVLTFTDHSTALVHFGMPTPP